MKSILTRLSILLVPIATLSAAFAEGDPLSTIPHWLSEERRAVYYVPRPRLKVSLYHLGADDQFWDQLDVEISYNDVNLAPQLSALKAKFPGFQLTRPILEKAMDYQLMIPSLGVNQPVETLPGPNGPYFHWVKYVPKSQSQAIRGALSTDLPSAVRVSGKLGAHVPLPAVLERVELGDDTCPNLLQGGATVESVVRNFGQLQQRIASMPMRYSSTRDALERSVLEGCFQLANREPLGSFKDVLGLRLTLKAPGFRPSGETRKEQPALNSVPLYYDIEKDVR